MVSASPISARSGGRRPIRPDAQDRGRPGSKLHCGTNKTLRERRAQSPGCWPPRMVVGNGDELSGKLLVGAGDPATHHTLIVHCPLPAYIVRSFDSVALPRSTWFQSRATSGEPGG